MSKWMVASDLHGSEYYVRQLLDAFERENADKMLLLGDLLYHGPRNALPDEYNTQSVMEMLNGYKDKLVCVRGNCDAEVDQMVLDFPIMDDYKTIDIDGIAVFATHGHKWGPDNVPPIGSGDVLMCGHTHIPAYRQLEGIVYMNPGSVSIPKAGSHHGYMTVEAGTFCWKNLAGEVIDTFNLNS